MSITLHTGDEGEQKLAFVRAVLPELLRWACSTRVSVSLVCLACHSACRGALAPSGCRDARDRLRPRPATSRVWGEGALIPPPPSLRWDNPSSPSHGFHRAMAICGVDPEDASTSAVEALLEAPRHREAGGGWRRRVHTRCACEQVLHHTQGTVLLDQLLLLAPLLLLGSWQAGGGHGSATLLLGGAVLLVLFVRLTYLGVLQ